MASFQYDARRATLDDLPKLVKLWDMERLPIFDLEKRFTEFQVIEDPSGDLIAAMGMQISGQQGKLHSEVFVPFDKAEALRAAFWERFLIVARNHGLFRVWTQLPGGFWDSAGFTLPTTDALSKMPEIFGSRSENWRMLTLKDESPATLSVEQQFAAYREAERERLNTLIARGKMIKWGALGILLVVFATLAGYLFIAFARNRRSR
jgi:N-acetylglutamate synthase-like GNAT family acetyltransferase